MAKRLRRFGANIGLLSIFISAAPLADTKHALLPDSISTQVRYTKAFSTDNGEEQQSRIAVTPEAKWRFGRNLRAEASLRLELADDVTGLGSTAGYSDLSKPWVDASHARIELDRAHVTWRSGGTRVRFGKQVTAWGVLDGLRITDRFDAVRRRDFVYTQVRPERIARWGLQARTDVAGWTIETSAAVDPTVSQQANLGDAFAPRAMRFTGGVDLSSLGESIRLQTRTSGRNAYGRDITYGGRTSRDIGTGRLSLLAFRGPTTDPVLEWAGNVPGEELELRHPVRTLIGATLDYTLGSTVLRAELAYIPDQPVNLQRGTALETDADERWLAGFAVDINAPFGIFVNAQLAVDHMRESTDEFVRPQTDLIATVRAQRSYPQAGWRLQAEWLGSFSDGDGVVRPEISKELNDKVSLTLGGDFAFGDRQGLFGQFESKNRAWLRLQLNL